LTLTQPSSLVVYVDSSASQGGGSAITGRTTSFGDGAWVSWQSQTTHTYAKTGNYTITVIVKNQAGQTSTTSSVKAVK
jgi:PKD repeat protein